MSDSKIFIRSCIHTHTCNTGNTGNNKISIISSRISNKLKHIERRTLCVGACLVYAEKPRRNVLCNTLHALRYLKINDAHQRDSTFYCVKALKIRVLFCDKYLFCALFLLCTYKQDPNMDESLPYRVSNSVGILEKCKKCRDLLINDGNLQIAIMAQVKKNDRLICWKYLDLSEHRWHLTLKVCFPVIGQRLLSNQVKIRYLFKMKFFGKWPMI